MITEDQVVLPVLKTLNAEPTGKLRTGELRDRVKAILPLTRDDLRPLSGRQDTRIDQIIRNLKSHKKSDGNPFAEGLLKDVPRGFAITQKGRKAISD